MKKSKKELPTNDEMIENCNEFIKKCNELSEKIDLIGIRLNELNELKKELQNDIN